MNMKNQVQDIMVSLVGEKRDLEKIAGDFKGKFGKMLGELSPEEKSALDDLILRCLETGNDYVIDTFVAPILQKKKFIAWKTKSFLIQTMLRKIVEVSKEKEGQARFNGVGEKLMEMMEVYQITKNFKAELMDVMGLSFNVASPEQCFMHLSALHVFQKFPWKDPAAVTTMMTMAIDYVMQHGRHDNQSVFCSNLMSFFLFGFYLRGGDLENHTAVLGQVTKCFVTSVGKEWEAEEDPAKGNIYRCFVLQVLQYYVQTNNGTKAQLLKPMYPCIRDFRGTTGDDEIEEIVARLMADVADEMGGEDVGGLLCEFVEGRNDALANKLKDIYLKQPDSFEGHLESLSSLLKVPNDSTCSQLVMFFTEVAKLKPETLPPSTSAHMANILNHQWYYSLALMYYDALATSRPDDVIKYESDVMACALKQESAAVLVANMLPKIAIDNDKKVRYLSYLAQEGVKKRAGPFLTSYLNNMRVIGLDAPPLLAHHRKFFDECLEVASARDLAQSCIDVIEGRSLQKVSKKTEENRLKLQTVQEGVAVLAEDLGEMKEQLDEVDESMDGLKRDVDENAWKVRELDGRVDETQIQVKEIDQKTLSHAPSWSRDVSRLLNDQSEGGNGKDWKLLGRRLGYSNDDLANWSLHSDPCMTLLDDWFACHNAREATRGVLSILDDMQATEAWMVVKEAVEKAEDIFDDKDADDDDDAKQPVVFLSYQWAHQQEVLLLRRHLEMCGFVCWMDIGQMGGGDKLYRKIDEGMRKVKLVLCCVSSRYAESANCNREVNLAVTLGKPMIPLLMEETAWPPVGGMGPIMGEFLYIQFFKKDSPYRKWFKPSEDVTKAGSKAVKKSDTTKPSQKAMANTTSVKAFTSLTSKKNEASSTVKPAKASEKNVPKSTANEKSSSTLSKTTTASKDYFRLTASMAKDSEGVGSTSKGGSTSSSKVSSTSGSTSSSSNRSTNSKIKVGKTTVAGSSQVKKKAGK